MYYWWDPTYILVVIGAIICLIASARVKTTYAKYSKYRSMSGLTGAQAAERILHDAGIYDVQVGHISGNLTDHYNPKTKVLNLSDSVYGSTSVAAIGVAAHECGHALQHQEGYKPLTFRNMIVPVCNISQTIGWIAILLGLFIGKSSISWLGVLLMSLMLLFQIVTLPVEFDASSRALSILNDRYLTEDEYPGAKKMLTAAALTYVAAAASSILQLLRLLLLFGGRRDD